MSTAGFTYRKTLFCNKTDQASLQCDLHYPNDERENVTFLAQLCQQTGRYDEMAINMKEITKFGGELSVEERDLLFEAYTHVITTRRTSWRIISSIKRKEESRGSRKHISAIHCYLQKIEAELECICQDILDVLDNSLIPKAESDESKVFYHKMKGDYHRYLAEFALGEERKVATTAAYEAYQAATDVAHDKLNPTHPIRLILALNFSVFYYDIMNLPGPACHLAKQAFDDAFVELDSVPTESYCNCALIMQLLRDNLRRWRSSNGADEFSDEPRKGPEPKDDVSATVA